MTRPLSGLVLAARAAAKLDPLAEETGAETVSLDATDPAAMEALFANLHEAPRLAIYNPSMRVRGPITDVDPDEVLAALKTTAFGAFLMGRAAARRMLETELDDRGKRGTILFTGASAGVKGYPESAAFAMGKFAERGLSESMARELHPRGIHVAWINIDGMIRNPGRSEPPDNPDSMLDPDAIAASYLQLIEQDRSAWSHELVLRPWVERF